MTQIDAMHKRFKALKLKYETTRTIDEENDFVLGAFELMEEQDEFIQKCIAPLENPPLVPTQFRKDTQWLGRIKRPARQELADMLPVPHSVDTLYNLNDALHGEWVGNNERFLVVGFPAFRRRAVIEDAMYRMKIGASRFCEVKEGAQVAGLQGLRYFDVGADARECGMSSARVYEDIKERLCINGCVPVRLEELPTN